MINDFGFVHINKEEELVAEDNKASKIMNLILPLLDNLKGDRDSDTIRWPADQRITQIESFKTTLEGIMNES